jgi:hypothetical protein
MNFRKVVFALATAGLGLTGVASAQVSPVTCNSGAATPAFVRAEGTTEGLPPITIGGCTDGGTLPTTISVSVTTTAGVTNMLASGSTTNSDATASFFGGAAVPGVISGNTITFTATGASIGVIGTTPNIVISNLRVNASSVPANQSITATVAPASGIILTSTAASAIPVAYTQAGVAKPTVLGFKNQAICSAGSAVVPLVEAEISSAFAGSFAPSPGAAAAAGEYVTVNFGNLPAGANYYTYTSITGAGNALGGLTATLVSGYNSTAAVAGGSIGPSGATVTGVAQLTATNGTATAIFWVTGASASATDAFAVPLFAVTTSGATAGINSAPTVAAQLTSPATGYDQFSATQTPQTATASSSATALTGLAFPTVTINSVSYNGTTNTGTGELTSCATTLLFPYILNSGGYDTGIAFTNASAGTSVSQDGTCSMMFYGTGAPSTNPYVTGTITAGTVGAFTVSSVASGFQGYAIATCNFQDAHGFAFITDGYGQAGRGLSQGYLAPITSANGSSVSSLF